MLSYSERITASPNVDNRGGRKAGQPKKAIAIASRDGISLVVPGRPRFEANVGAFEVLFQATLLPPTTRACPSTAAASNTVRQKTKTKTFQRLHHES